MKYRKGAVSLDWAVNIATWIIILLVMIAVIVAISNWVGKA